MTQSTNRLTNLQVELLKLFKYNLSQKQLLEVKDLLAKYFAGKATREMDKLWEEKGLTDETMDSWLNAGNTFQCGKKRNLLQLALDQIG